MNLKKHWGKHVLTLIILGVFAFLAAGSSIRDHAKKGMKAYKAGDYETAKKLWEKSSHITTPDYTTYAEACWFLGEIYYDEGNKEKALEYKIKAYNYLLENDTRIKEAQKMESGVYDKMMSDPQIKEKLAQQEKEDAKPAKGNKTRIGDRTVFSTAKLSLQNIAKDPDSIQIYQQEILESKMINGKNYFIVQMEASGTNSFGGRVRSWYIVEVIIGNDYTKYTRDNIQSFDSKPSSTEISICEAIFGW